MIFLAILGEEKNKIANKLHYSYLTFHYFPFLCKLANNTTLDSSYRFQKYRRTLILLAHIYGSL